MNTGRNIAGLIGAKGSVRRKKLEAGSSLAFQGDSLEAVYVILRGLVELVRTEENGTELLIGMIEENEFLGELEYFLEIPLWCHMRCVYDCEFLVVPRPEFRQLVDTNPELREVLFESLSLRLHNATARTSDSSAYPTDETLLKLIAENNRRDITYTRKMYADYLGLSERSVNRAIRRLEDAGLLVRNRQSLRVIDS